jgi:hypothetical protein
LPQLVTRHATTGSEHESKSIQRAGIGSTPTERLPLCAAPP